MEKEEKSMKEVYLEEIENKIDELFEQIKSLQNLTAIYKVLIKK